VLDPGDSDEPGSTRRIALATYADYDDFVERLPAYIAEITRDVEGRIRQMEEREAQIKGARKQLTALTRRRAQEART